ncbi:Rha family transcriptional regulator [Modicisalibacter coralii]|uniref:Rha family transcriptional regulator n=1 Tax=Modicisalibacter coralii TaxID=2304602 RepID=UPI00100A69F2|nr:Rha family transcriptional regulator [Halomonas coralii]
MVNVTTQNFSAQHIAVSTAATMSSREIADLTGKQHKNVMADIRSMCEQLDISSAEFSAQYQDSTGRSLPCFKLDRYHTEVLVTGYDVKRRAAVIKRWHDLESGSAQPVGVSASQKDMIEGAGAFLDALRVEGSSRITCMKAFAASNCPQYLPLIPDYAVDAPAIAGGGSSLPTASASDLLKRHAAGVSAAFFNKVCHSQGILEKKSRTSSKGKEVGYWCLTHLGLEYGKNITSPQSPRQTQPHWYEDKFDDLLQTLGLSKAA